MKYLLEKSHNILVQMKINIICSYMNQQYYSMKEDNLEIHHYMLVLFHAKENLEIIFRKILFI